MNKTEKVKIISIVALYKPSIDDLKNIINYINSCDMCILMDDSDTSSEQIVMSYFDEKYRDKLMYIWNGTNIGLCASVNRGMEIAEKNGADWILLMNPDSIMRDSDIEEFRNFIRQYSGLRIAAIAPQYDYDRHPRKRYTGYRKIRWANMSGMCIKVATLKIIGQFEERLFIDGLDLEWGIRAYKQGYEIIEIGSAIMEHHPAETKIYSICGRKIFMYGWASPIRYYYQFRSNHYMIKKYRSFEALKCQIIKLSKVLLLFDNKREYLKMYKKAISDCRCGKWCKYQDED